MNSEANSASKLVLLAAGVLGLCAALSAHAHDYPTADRVIYVQECMRQHPGPHFEMLNKCSCAIDTIARTLSYDQYVTMTTAVNANSIGGERGAYIRDVDSLQQQIREFRKLQDQALKGCFVGTTAPH